jgi:hypothetical protein
MTSPAPKWQYTHCWGQQVRNFAASRCILQRLQCRDFYDLYILLYVERVDPQEAVELFRRKARHLNLDPDTFGD